MSGKPFSKLSARYYGPYQILQRVGPIAYKLSLPPQLLLHPTFHVSQLKLCYKLSGTISHPPIIDLSSPYCPLPEKILERRMIQKENKDVAQVLIQWKQVPIECATWEDYRALKIRFSAFLP